MRTLQRWLEAAFETFLFNSRLIVILAVLGSLAASVVMFVRGVMVVVSSVKDFFSHLLHPTPGAHDAHDGGEDLAIAMISSVDNFLFATVLLIFAMGIYELFISKIDPASRTSESRPNWLQIHSLDDLKGAVGKVILMILIVRLFEAAVKMHYDQPLHLVYLGVAVLFVAAALYLQQAAHKFQHHGPDASHNYPPPPPDDEAAAHGHAVAGAGAHGHAVAGAGAHASAVGHAQASHVPPPASALPVPLAHSMTPPPQFAPQFAPPHAPHASHAGPYQATAASPVFAPPQAGAAPPQAGAAPWGQGQGGPQGPGGWTPPT
jgi:uncharacterized membrane protein YqhA